MRQRFSWLVAWPIIHDTCCATSGPSIAWLLPRAPSPGPKKAPISGGGTGTGEWSNPWRRRRTPSTTETACQLRSCSPTFARTGPVDGGSPGALPAVLFGSLDDTETPPSSSVSDDSLSLSLSLIILSSGPGNAAAAAAAKEPASTSAADSAPASLRAPVLPWSVEAISAASAAAATSSRWACAQPPPPPSPHARFTRASVGAVKAFPLPPVASPSASLARVPGPESRARSRDSPKRSAGHIASASATACTSAEAAQRSNSASDRPPSVAAASAAFSSSSAERKSPRGCRGASRSGSLAT
mmetsp:Transcript_47583/g.107938  ORF Transcript_47583/g.107938 Transcript_47583/m.107938 type:complete len:300 (-) Transcript_47583:266-1165(-)